MNQFLTASILLSAFAWGGDLEVRPAGRPVIRFAKGKANTLQNDLYRAILLDLHEFRARQRRQAGSDNHARCAHPLATVQWSELTPRKLNLCADWGRDQAFYQQLVTSIELATRQIRKSDVAGR